MKLRVLLLLLFLLAVTIYSCQKEVAAEETPATGTLKANITGDCLPITVNGTYKKDTTLTNSNYIEVQVHITAVGLIEISSDTVNGFYFLGAANALDTGITTIRLYGHGTPAIATATEFEISFDNSSCTVAINVTDQTTNSNAVFTLGVSGNNCTGVVTNGVYVSGVGMNSLNYIKIDVAVSSPGTYSITTNSSNGVTFSATGIFPAPGNHQLTLMATGIPAAAGNFTYTVSAASSQCQFLITYTATSAPAVFTTSNTSGNCNPITINGTYKAGVPLSGTNTVSVQVNVTTPGTYSITTAPAVNGITFNGAGVFSTTGLKTIILYGIGTPTAEGTNTFTIAGASGCSFDIITQSNGGTATGVFTCKIDGVFTTFNIDASFFTAFPTPSWGQAMEVSGKNAASGSERMSLDINRTEQGTFIVPGAYGQGFPLRIAQIYYHTANNVFWYGISTVNPISINITSISSSNVKGSFTGRVYDSPMSGSAFKIITEGVFDVPVQ